METINFEKDLCRIQPTNEEENDFVIMIGNQIAHPEHFKTRREAQIAINKKDWNIIVTAIILFSKGREEK